MYEMGKFSRMTHRCTIQLRPSLRFSLSFMFAIVSFVCLWFGWVVSDVRNRMAAIEMVNSQGGAVFCHYHFDEFGELNPGSKPTSRNVFFCCRGR